MWTWVRRTGMILLIPVAFMLLVSVLLWVPAVQNAVAKKAMTYLSESTGLDIGFERIQLSLPLNLSARKVFVKGTENDTLAYLRRLSVGVRLRPLQEGRISIKKFHLTSLELNTGSFLDGMVIQGKAAKISLSADSIDWTSGRLELNSLVLSNAVIDLFMDDTTASDTTDSTLDLFVGVKRIELKNIAFSLRMPYDSVFVSTKVERAVARNGFADIGTEEYGASGFRAKINGLSYATDTAEASPGLDASHLLLTDLTLAADTLYYNSEGTMCATIKDFSAKERSGLVIQSMTGRFMMDSLQLIIPSLELATSASNFQLQAIVPWASILTYSDRADLQSVRSQAETLHATSLQLKANTSIHKQDMLLLMGNTSNEMLADFPETALKIEVDASGDRKDITLKKLEVELPDAFNIRLEGTVNSFDNERLRSGRVDYEVNTKKMNFVAGLLEDMLPSGFQIPDMMSLAGHLTLDKGVYATETTGREGGGNVRLSGRYDIFKENYEVDLSVNCLEPVHFMPDDSILWVSAVVRAKGHGTDPFHAATQTEISGRINEMQYGSSLLTDITFSGSLQDNQLQAELESGLPFVKGRISVDGTIRKDTVSGFLIIDLDSLDLYGLQLTETPLSTSFQLFSEFETDLDKSHSLDITIGNWMLNIDTQLIEPKMLTLNFRTNPDTTHATFYAGDLSVMLTGNTDIETFSNKLMLFVEEAQAQYARYSTIDIQELRPFFPDMSLQIQADRDNTLSHFLQNYNAFFDRFHLDATLSPEEGLTVESGLFALVKDTLKIDTIRINVWQDTSGLLYKAGVVKNRFRNQESFHLNVNGYFRKYEADLFVSYLNSRGEKGVHLGVNAKKESDGYSFHFYPEQLVIAFLPFTINEDNYFYFTSLNDMEADVRLTGRDNANIWIYSDYQDNCMNDLMVEFNHLNLAEISDKFPDIPPLKGLLNIACRYMPIENSFMVVADGNIDDFYFEGAPIGDLLINASYLPISKGTHQVDLHVFHDSKEVTSLSVTYQEGRDENKLEGIISVNQLPLQLINPMIPAQMVRMTGEMNGKFNISGTDNDPELSGSLQLDDVSAYVVPSSTTLHFDNQPVKLTKNKLTFDKYKIYTLKDNPFVIEGTIDATNTSNPVADLRMSATNMQLVDSKRTAESLVYGKLFVNFNSTLNGPLQAMRMRGTLRILGNSNFTYVMADSPFDMEDNFGDLVTFTYLADTLPRPLYLMRGVSGAAAATGTDMLMTISIDPVVRLRIDLDKEQSNYVEVRGGGNLSLQYTMQGDLRLNGRYTLSDGTIRYSIPVIPLTEFFVKNGSYVDWNGNPMNPYLNMTAYTRVRSSVNLGGQSQKVDFNTGIQLRDYLEDMSIQFLLEAPTNAVMQNQLTAMGVEERSKQAVSLLVTGVYLAGSGSGIDNMDVGAALNSLLQREIKNILGSMLGDVPFSFDVNTYDGTQGMGRRIDYLGRFYKDFFNERMSATLGMRYSTKDPVFGNKYFFDDISLGYRLDMDGSRQIQLFMNKEYLNLFEGEINRYGAGFTLQRKVKRFNDLFNFRRPEAVVIKKEEEDE